MNAIESAIFLYLDTYLSVPSYLHEAPQEEAGPFVVFAVSERSDIGGTAPLVSIEIETTAVAGLHSGAEEIAGELRMALNDWRWGAPGVRIGPCNFANRDDGFDSTLQKYRVTLTWAAQALLY